MKVYVVTDAANPKRYVVGDELNWCVSASLLFLGHVIGEAYDTKRPECQLESTVFQHGQWVSGDDEFKIQRIVEAVAKSQKHQLYTTTSLRVSHYAVGFPEPFPVMSAS